MSGTRRRRSRTTDFKAERVTGRTRAVSRFLEPVPTEAREGDPARGMDTDTHAGAAPIAAAPRRRLRQTDGARAGSRSRTRLRNCSRKL